MTVRYLAMRQLTLPGPVEVGPGEEIDPSVFEGVRSRGLEALIAQRRVAVIEGADEAPSPSLYERTITDADRNRIARLENARGAAADDRAKVAEAAKAAVEEEESEPEAPASFDIGTATVAQVLSYAEAHPDDVPDMLAAERDGKDRPTLIAGLEKLLADPEADPDGD